MRGALKSRIRSARDRRDLAALVDQRRRRPRDRELGLAIHQAISSGLEFAGPLVSAPRRHTGKRQRTLVIVETGTDRGVLPEFLRALPDSDAYAETAAIGEGIDGIPITPAEALAGQGTTWDMDLCRATDVLAGEICGALDRHIPRDERTVADIDSVAVLDFFVGDRTYKLGRIVRVLIERMSSGQYGSVVFLQGNERLRLSLEPAAEAAVGAENVHLFWLPAGASKSSAKPTQPGPELVAPSPTDVAFLVQPMHRLTREMSRVAAAVGERRRVTFLAPARQVAAHAGNCGHLAALTLERPVQFSFVSPDRDLPAPPRADKHLSTKISTDSQVAGLQLDGAPIGPLLAPVVHATLVEWQNLKRFAVGFAEYVRSAQPKALVVCPDRTPTARAACQIARAHGVTSFYPVPGLLSENPRYKELQADFGSLMDDGQVKIQATMHPRDAGRLVADGITDLDGATTAWLTDAGRLPDQACVALALQPMPLGENADLIRLVGEAITGLDAQLVVRPHPREPIASRRHYSELVEQLPRASLDVGSLPDLLRRSTLVVGGFSTVLMEAAIAGRPVLSVNLSRNPFPLSFGDMGIAQEVRDRSALRAAVRGLLTDQEAIAAVARRQQEYFDRNPHLRAGPAALRIADRIEGLVRSHQGD